MNAYYVHTSTCRFTRYYRFQSCNCLYELEYGFFFKLRNEEKNVASGPEYTSLTVDDDAYDGLFYR